ncbi:hypothetical protein QJS66_20825 [Kocuria rhizophila]|nr:hypothetical protein QJS66_20825 [Kocuria rhizophila]
MRGTGAGLCPDRLAHPLQAPRNCAHSHGGSPAPGLGADRPRHPQHGHLPTCASSDAEVPSIAQAGDLVNGAENPAEHPGERLAAGPPPDRWEPLLRRPQGRGAETTAHPREAAHGAASAAASSLPAGARPAAHAAPGTWTPCTPWRPCCSPRTWPGPCSTRGAGAPHPAGTGWSPGTRRSCAYAGMMCIRRWGRPRRSPWPRPTRARVWEAPCCACCTRRPCARPRDDA